MLLIASAAHAQSTESTDTLFTVNLVYNIK